MIFEKEIRNKRLNKVRFRRKETEVERAKDLEARVSWFSVKAAIVLLGMRAVKETRLRVHFVVSVRLPTSDLTSLFNIQPI